ncbi:hypothetical protein ACWGFX_38315 [Streptomyces xanthophaeus]
MIWQWTGLAVFSLTLLPAGLAMATGRVPARLRARLTPVRVHGWGHPRHLRRGTPERDPPPGRAAPELSLALTATAGIVAAAGCLVAGLARLATAGNGTP